MRIIFAIAATASLCLLAACNRGAANNSTNAPAPAANAAEPAAAAPAAPAPAAPAASAAAGEIAECVSGAPGNLPEGTDATAFCTCAVGKIGTGTSQRDAMNQCASEMGITLPNRE